MAYSATSLVAACRSGHINQLSRAAAVDFGIEPIPDFTKGMEQMFKPAPWNDTIFAAWCRAIQEWKDSDRALAKHLHGIVTGNQPGPGLTAFLKDHGVQDVTIHTVNDLVG